MNKTFIISGVVSLVLIAILILIIGPASILRTIDHISIEDCFILVFFSLLALFFSALSINNALNVYNVKIDLLNLLFIKIIGFSANYIAPSGLLAGFIGGDAVMALILKKKKGLEFKQGFSAGLASKVVEFSVFLVFIYLGLILGFKYFYLPPEIWVFLFIAGIFIGVMTLFFLLNPIIDNRFFTKILISLSKIKFLNKIITKITSHINELEKEMHFFFTKGAKYLLLSVFLSLLVAIILILQIWLLVHYLGIDMGFSKTLLVFSVSMLVFALPLAPGSAGTYELSQVGLFDLLGMGSDVGLTFSLIMRIINLAIVGFSFIILPHYGINLFKKDNIEKI
ncbi:MAG: lysylphosphatidylglycerol synthase transmembrane domain-containing protein [bacterium]